MKPTEHDVKDAIIGVGPEITERDRDIYSECQFDTCTVCVSSRREKCLAITEEKRLEAPKCPQ